MPILTYIIYFIFPESFYDDYSFEQDVTEKLESVTPTVNVKTYSSLGNLKKKTFTLTNNQNKNDIFVVNELNPYKGTFL